jgi:hypothetical protein
MVKNLISATLLAKGVNPRTRALLASSEDDDVPQRTMAYDSYGIACSEHITFPGFLQP